MKTRPFLFIAGILVSLLLSLSQYLPVYAQTPSTDGGTGGFGVSTGGGSSGCETDPGSSATENSTTYSGSDDLHSLFSDAVYYIPPEFFRVAGEDRYSADDDLMCIKKGPETVCVPYESGSSGAEHPCETFTMTPGGITCANTQWYINARVNFPITFLDLRPYPVTLVRWPTAARCGGLPSSSGQGTYPYVAYGGGSPGNPQPGDWRNLVLTLTLNPAGPMFFSMPHIGEMMLQPVGSTGSPEIFRWELPSHPAAGGGPLAGSVGLSELPGDMPLFVGEAKSPYRLFWRFTYEEAVAIMDCVSGPNGDGGYDCDGGSGHMEMVGIEWAGRGMGGEIQPEDVPGVPESMKADLNHDGDPDAYWDRLVTIRRMDDNNSISGRWAASYSFGGGVVYWGVREGQAQIGWPGVP
ncbi:MAG: hypothetical protein ISS57_17800 [Anaerolineales bacterium]|nr:hypothetical protein [Anaerolineales bacterium]